MSNVVLMDVDGVLCNWVQGIIDSVGMNVTHDDYVSWDHHKILGYTDSQIWEPTREPGWWEKLEPYPWAKSLVNSVRSAGFFVVFCTSPGTDHKCSSEKINWLRNHELMSKFANHFQIGPYKHLSAGSGAILIDDSDSNINSYRKHGGRAILFPQPWNAASHLLPGIDRNSYVMGALLRIGSHPSNSPAINETLSDKHVVML